MGGDRGPQQVPPREGSNSPHRDTPADHPSWGGEILYLQDPISLETQNQKKAKSTCLVLCFKPATVPPG